MRNIAFARLYQESKRAVFVLDKHHKPLMPCPQSSLCFAEKDESDPEIPQFFTTTHQENGSRLQAA
ncbi:MAG: hypothetical protein IJS54_00140 [Desulfovibrio sp.]|nr:hypothetical protein [Desulfovibrio sp.]